MKRRMGLAIPLALWLILLSCGALQISTAEDTAYAARVTLNQMLSQYLLERDQLSQTTQDKCENWFRLAAKSLDAVDLAISNGDTGEVDFEEFLIYKRKLINEIGEEMGWNQ